ncbi:hypothetical protein BG006_000080 [Podila minutissima]|uniref:4'-phosphopantetheinyl transferase domain-containing protein n=1 Tax=Podila minutissima TaxID=64525 RepID=A0A9P5VPG9_9FUNG|nr:hypothetical protein BG006_000080 [Podila minutissima]KAG0357034.1 hypothetical protein BG005_003995 [Podila minutissima]
MILGIGVDILHLPRLKGLLSRRPDRFLTRILTEVEQKEFKVLQQQAGGADQEGPLRYLGARWALKEASYKALYPHHKLTWQDVTVAKQDGKPTLVIPEKERFGIGKSHCSVSHDGEYLVGQVLFESP